MNDENISAQMVLYSLPLPALLYVISFFLLRKSKIQFGIVDLLLLPIAFLPFLKTAAEEIVWAPDYERKLDWGYVIIFLMFTTSGALLGWSAFRYFSPNKRWLPSVCMVFGAWLGFASAIIALYWLSLAGFHSRFF